MKYFKIRSYSDWRNLKCMLNKISNHSSNHSTWAIHYQYVKWNFRLSVCSSCKYIKSTSLHGLSHITPELWEHVEMSWLSAAQRGPFYVSSIHIGDTCHSQPSTWMSTLFKCRVFIVFYEVRFAINALSTYCSLSFRY